MTISDSELARLAGVSVPVLKAIRTVESRGAAGTLRFEPHVFLRDTSPVCRDRTPPCTATEIIANAIYSPSQIPYTPGTTGCRISRAASCIPAETNRTAFQRAFALDPRAAVRATSWGTYQVLGNKLLPLYDNDPGRAVAAFWANPTDVSNRMLVRWMNDNPRAVEAANELDWYGFVSRYNGCSNCDVYLARFEEAYAAVLRGGGGGLLLLAALGGGWYWWRRRRR